MMRADQISRANLGQHIETEVHAFVRAYRATLAVSEAVVGQLRWFTHTSDSVVVSVEHGDGGAFEWELPLNHEVTLTALPESAVTR